MIDAPTLSIREVDVSFDARRVLSVPALDIAEGEAVGLFGSNGSGKSTLLKTIMGHVQPQSGAIMIDGRDVVRLASHDRVKRQRLGYVSQSLGSFRDLTVRENLRLGRAAVGANDRPYAALVAEASACVGLEDAWGRIVSRSSQLAGDLSGGEQRLLSILLVLCGRPRILLLDEPLAGASPQLRQIVCCVIHQLHAAGTTLIVAEQNILEVASVVRRALVLRNGAIVYDGPPERLEDRAHLLSLM